MIRINDMILRHVTARAIAIKILNENRLPDPGFCTSESAPASMAEAAVPDVRPGVYTGGKRAAKGMNATADKVAPRPATQVNTMKKSSSWGAGSHVKNAPAVRSATRMSATSPVVNFRMERAERKCDTTTHRTAKTFVAATAAVMYVPTDHPMLG